MKEKLLEILANLGFQIDEVDERVAHFEYEELDMLAPYPSDDEFLSIIVPGIMRKEDAPELFDLIIAKVNADTRYVKAYENKGVIWLCYERECINGEVSEEEVERMILHLYLAYRFIGEIIREADVETEEDGDNSEDKEE